MHDIRTIDEIQIETPLSRDESFDLMVPKIDAEHTVDDLIFNCDNYQVTPKGLYFLPPSKSDENGDSDDKSDPPIRICSPIWPIAHLRNREGKDHSLLLKIYDGERFHFWAMPKRLIAKINEINDVLLNFGIEVPIYPNSQKHLQTFLMRCAPQEKMRCVDKAGWHGNQYIFPNGQVIGKGIEGEGVYPLNDICPRGVEEKGSLKDWQDNVLPLCKGNSRLIFSIGTALASLCLVDEDSGGFNFKGRSSIGKTKCLRLAISVIGSRDYQRSWKATSNGLEGVCALHNDSLLPLDEFGQQDASEAGEIAYMVSSGIGKQRSSRDGSARDPRTWRVMILSTGEVGLEGHMQEGKKKAKAGQLTRIVDIPADAGKDYGCFEEIHGMQNGAEFADELDRVCNLYFGTAARAFVQNIIEYGVETAKKEIRFAADDFVTEKAHKSDGQVKRVARRFGLVYGALILANKLKITAGISIDESKEAVTACYKAWLLDRGTDEALEPRSLIDHFIGVLQENYESKFANRNPSPEEGRYNVLWGYKEGPTLYLLPKAFKDICSGYENAAKTLIDAGVLIPSGDGKSSQPVRISAHPKKQDRFYVVNLEYNE